MNLMMLLEMSAQGFGERVAVTDGANTISYAQLFAAAGQVGAQLRQCDAQHLAMLDVTSFALPIGLFGSAWAGIPFAPINYRLPQDAIDALLERLAPCTLITDAARLETLPRNTQTTGVTAGAFISAACTGQEAVSNDWPMEPENTAVLLFTSGTTGTPKAAVLRQRHLVSYIFSAVEFASAEVDEAVLVCVPPYHIAGVVSVLSSVYAGRKIVQLPNFNARQWIELAVKENVTSAFLVPTMLRAIVAELEAQPDLELPSLRALAYGGGRMPLPVIERAMSRLSHVKFTQAYGLTETSSTICMLLPQDHLDAMAGTEAHVRRRLTSVGRALPGIELQIRDDQGSVLAPGERGEIYVRGEQVSGEYVGKGSTLDDQGWFPTRDAGEMDEEGFLFLEGRSDDVIVRGAENMSPGEIEDVLMSHSAIADAAVVGVPDEQWGEAVAAVVVVKPGETTDAGQLQSWVKRHLRSSKVPQKVLFTDALPYNETGKLLRRVVREDLAAAS